MKSYANFLFLFVQAVFLISTTSAFGITYLVAADDAPPAVKAAADYVCDGNDDEVQINSAINTAGTDDIVQLSQGNFKINNTGKPDTWVSINKSNITLQGNGPTGPARTTLLDQQSDNSFIIVSDGLSRPSNITIKDLEIDATDDTCWAGVYVWGAQAHRPSYITVDNLVVKGGAGEALSDGIYAEYTDDMNITNCDVYDCYQTGIYIFRNVDTLIQYNYVENGGWLTDIRSLDSTRTQQLDNEVVDNDIVTEPGASANERAISGIIICCGLDCVMQYNTVNGSRHGCVAGSYYAPLDNGQIVNNTITNASRHGIWFCGSNQGYAMLNCGIANNTTTNNTLDGIHIGDSLHWPNNVNMDHFQITGNISTNNGEYGIRYVESAGTITNSTVSGNDFRYNALGSTCDLHLDPNILFYDNLVDPSVVIVESGGSTDVDEDGPTSDNYTVVLDTEPNDSVTITVDPDIDTEVNDNGAGNPIDLTFTTGDWNTPQTVTVKAIDDTDDEGEHTSTITHTASGGGYTGININEVVAAVTDNDAVELLTNPSFEADGDPTGLYSCVEYNTAEPTGWAFDTNDENNGLEQNTWPPGSPSNVSAWMNYNDSIQQVATSETIKNGVTYTFEVVGMIYSGCVPVANSGMSAKFYWTDTPADPFGGDYRLLKTLTITQGASPADQWQTQSTTWTAGAVDAGKYLFVHVDDGGYGKDWLCIDSVSITYSCGCGDADLDGDGDVDLHDYVRLAGCWLLNYGGSCGTGDINCNGTVGTEDLRVMVGDWLKNAGP